MTNLLDNALKYGPEGGRIVVQVGIPTEESVELVVQDQGIGCRRSTARTFSSGSTAHGATHQSGLGLGLYISREIVLRHGGDIQGRVPH